jgi:polysaccharide pyruvyl transferase WcaK-like protein
MGGYKLKSFSCPICDSEEFTIISESSEGFKWGVCKQCGLTAPQIKGYIKYCDYFISMRFHASIAALSQSIPTIVLGYSEKFDYLYKFLELNTKYVLKYEDINLNYLNEIFNSLISEDNIIKTTLKKNIFKFQNMALNNGLIVKKEIANNE